MSKSAEKLTLKEIEMISDRIERLEKNGTGELRIIVNDLKYETQSNTERSKDNQQRIYTVELKTVNYDNMQKIVYGLVALALTSLAGAVIALTLK